MGTGGREEGRGGEEEEKSGDRRREEGRGGEEGGREREERERGGRERREREEENVKTRRDEHIPPSFFHKRLSLLMKDSNSTIKESPRTDGLTSFLKRTKSLLLVGLGPESTP